jgi:hypothetical protein
MQALNLLGLPTTILVGPGGVELARHVGGKSERRKPVPVGQDRRGSCPD